jgi:hypothetical protein
MNQRAWLAVIVLMMTSQANATTTERIQRYKGIEVTQAWDPGCVKLTIKYQGRQSGEESVQVLVNLNGANRIFNMVREKEQHVLNLSSCPVTCDTVKDSSQVCSNSPAEMRRLFYWAMSNGQPSSWFVQTTFIGKTAATGRENYGFYFP